VIKRVPADDGSSPSRRISIAAAVVFAMLAVTAMVLVFRTEHHVEGNRAAGDAAQGFGSLSSLIQSQELLALQYGERPAIRYDFIGLTREVNARLDALRDKPREAQDATRLATDYGLYLVSARRYFTAIDAALPQLARQIESKDLGRASSRLNRTAVGITERNATQAGGAAAKLEDVSETMIVILAVAFVLAGTALLLLSRAGRRSQEAEAEARAEVKILKHAARTDSLTGLNNHRAFEADLGAAIAEAGRNNAPVCLVSLDLKGLKRVNETQGHQAGDRRLRQVGAALAAATTEPDTAYRVGGDEFAVLLRGTGAWTGLGMAERIRSELSSGEAKIEVVAGIAEGRPLEGAFDLVRHADLALINAKRTHRQAIIYSQELEGTVEGEPVPLDNHHYEVLASALARAVDAKDSYTRSHSETVSNLCVVIGTELGLSPERLEKLRIAGLLHDVGKIGTPDEILQKPGKLTDAEYETIKQHPVLGESILRSADLNRKAGWVRHHHERPDGRGYPDGLAGDEIPLEALIIGVADAFEAMISDRPYGRRRSEREALEELERCSGTQFDPKCVAALRKGLRVITVTPARVNGNGARRRQPARSARRARSAV
jgi:diguanylate cyclase (GGDEF)-like protein